MSDVAVVNRKIVDRAMKNVTSHIISLMQSNEESELTENW